MSVEITKRVWRAAQLRRLPLWLGGALPWLAIPSGPGLLAWAGWCALDWVKLRRRVTFEWTAWLDGAVPEMEDSAVLLESADTPIARLQQKRLFERLDAAISPAQLRQIVRQYVSAGYPIILISAALAAMVWFATNREQTVGVATPAGPIATANAAAAPPQLTLRIAPPAYTGVAPSESAPGDLQVPEQTVVSWCLKGNVTGNEKIELANGQVLAPGKECARWTALESVLWRWRGERHTLRVIPDAPPEIEITAPTQMVQDLREGATGTAMAIRISDDYAVQRATLHLTLARGSGENVKFTDREMPLPASNNPKQRDWSKNWSLAELGMEPGDELYFFVRAADNATRPHNVQSPTYVIRLPAPEAEAEEDSAAMPSLVKPQSLRSQRQIIIDTEQLIADMRGKIGKDEVRDRAERIAGDQGALRRRYGQFLGEESTLFNDEAQGSEKTSDKSGEKHEEHDEHDGQDHSGHDHGEPNKRAGGIRNETEHILTTYGHAHDESENATMYDEGTKKVLRRALLAMWDAEKALRALDPKMALAPEHKALDAIKELQQAERIYLHKTAFTPPPITEEKRMTGDMDGTASYRREQSGQDAPLPEDLRALVQMLSGDGPLPALWTRTANDWVRTRIKDDEGRLAAQRSIQDVLDGCIGCRPALRAWLRSGAGEGQVLLQAKPAVETPFVRGWREGSK